VARNLFWESNPLFLRKFYFEDQVPVAQALHFAELAAAGD